MTVNGNLLIVGSGIAGLSAARSARKQYPHVRITLISEESAGFYNRIALGAFVCGKRTDAELFTYAAHLFDLERIETRWNQQVTEINASKKELRFEDGTVLAYDKLILALGATPVLPNIPGIDSEGVYSLWSLTDAHKLKSKLSTANTVCVIGGGVLGIEAAMDFLAQGKKVHLVEAQSFLLSHLVPPNIATKVANQLRQKGIAVHTGALANKIAASASGLTVDFSKKSLQSDLVLLSIGVSSSVALAKNAGLTTHAGIVVDDTLHTSDSDILACGNCIEQPQGGALLWNPAQEQGRIAGQNAFEVSNTFHPAPYPIHLKSDWLHLFAIGDKGKIDSNSLCVVEKNNNASWERAIYVSPDGTLLYAIFHGDISGYYELEKHFRTGQPLPQKITPSTTVNNIIESLNSSVDASAKEEPFTKTSWMCNVCGYTHEGEHAPDICPVCSVGRDQFQAA